MVFEDYYDTFFNSRRALEDPYGKIAVSKDEYLKLKKIAENYDVMVKKFKQLESQKSALEKEVETMKEDGRKLKELEEKTEKYLNSLLRTQADFENYKKQNNKRNEEYAIRAKEKLLNRLIKHFEDLQRNLDVLKNEDVQESILKGFELIIKNFEKILENEGIKPMNSEGKEFNVYEHEALMVEETEEYPDNTVLEELDKGYYINNQVLKPAGVKISKSKK